MSFENEILRAQEAALAEVEREKQSAIAEIRAILSEWEERRTDMLERCQRAEEYERDWLRVRNRIMEVEKRLADSRRDLVAQRN